MKSKKLNLIDLLPIMTFIVCFIEGEAASCYKLELAQILDVTDDYEYKYAIHERMEEVIALPVGGRLKMWFNRDNADDSTGFIKRII